MYYVCPLCSCCRMDLFSSLIKNSINRNESHVVASWSDGMDGWQSGTMKRPLEERGIVWSCNVINCLHHHQLKDFSSRLRRWWTYYKEALSLDRMNNAFAVCCSPSIDSGQRDLSIQRRQPEAIILFSLNNFYVFMISLLHSPTLNYDDEPRK